MLTDDSFDKPIFFDIDIPMAENRGFFSKCPGKPSPFFSIDSEDFTVSSFLRAVSDGSGDALCFLSKRCAGNVDLSALRDVLAASEYACLIPQKNPAPSSRKTKALLLFNREKGEKSVLLLRMIHEPDQFGQWKILLVEKE
ncbi:MAG: hypothetical protein FWF44_08020 [Defluviitaleaceae bacterium]|nr:hypothetical protein [Defluviitaleaceae bacterium]